MDLKIILDFIAAVNSHDAEKIGGLITADHVFTDSQGTKIKGRENNIRSWQAYFSLFPDYKIKIDDIYARNDTIALFGIASASHKGKKWKLPVAWKAVSKRKKISSWQVFADTKIQYDTLQRLFTCSLNMRIMKAFFSLLTILYLLSGCNVLYAQSFFIKQINNPADITLELRFIKTFVKNDNISGTFDGNYDLSVNIPLSNNFLLYAGIPITQTKAFKYSLLPIINEQYYENKTIFGNFYAGADYYGNSSPGHDVVISALVYFPTRPDLQSSYINNYLFDLYSPQKQYYGILTLSANMIHRWNREGFTYGLEIGPDLQIPTTGKSKRPEITLHYGFHGGFTGKDIAVSAEFGGLFYLSSNVKSFTDRFLNSIAIGATWKTYSVRPTMYYQLPIKEYYTKLIDGMLGIKISAEI